MLLKPAFLLALLGMWNAASATEVSVTASDGVTLHGTSWGMGSEGVLLLHDLGRDATDWATLGPKLGDAGFLTLALDLRGHGRSTTSATTPAPSDFAADVHAAVAWMTHAGVGHVHVVGAGFGGTLALIADDTAVADVITLSPPLRAGGLTVSAAAAAIGPRSLLVVGSRSDPAGAKAAVYLGTKATGPRHVELFANAASGARLLNAEPTLEPLVLSWLHRTHAAWAGSVANDQPAVQSEAVTEIEATGRRFGDR